MRLGSCLYQGNSVVFVESDGHYYLPSLQNAHATFWKDIQTLIADPKRDEKLAEFSPNKSCMVGLEDIQLLAPIPRPNKNIICMGLNYFDHIVEAADFAGRNAKTPKAPIVFTKSNFSVIGPGTPIPADPDISEQLDWEVELGVIIGKTGKAIKPEHVQDHIFGYTIINDISARDLQFAHKQFYIGKSIDGGCPMGPVIVSKDEIPNAQQLQLSCRVNGVDKQTGSTEQMIFDIEQIIVTLSKTMTLEAGDVIATGTPNGVGFARTPPEFLKSGDVVECEIESIGVLSNPVV
ncbi:fumarylacetoacetate hydrolase family protein [Leucothrix pacifica]|uniref:5-carboxymethyl-2-hydroxymuconate isomerase n=1 Tax=Leucothrix pacifica TaxID=1247513 RepID=A0A317CF95_9GAMM|nr:fumarylacetoacetate hydrolase family protein [Leucothrix pacifica]PWQ94832.1 5-carboxymethyl-2-hydroxymuconate isomerase [Leucothrix pacifica]